VDLGVTKIHVRFVADGTIVDPDVIEILAVAGEDVVMMIETTAIIVEDEIVTDAAIAKFV
jgi:hypothetical protein